MCPRGKLYRSARPICPASINLARTSEVLTALSRQQRFSSRVAINPRENTRILERLDEQKAHTTNSPSRQIRCAARSLVLPVRKSIRAPTRAFVRGKSSELSRLYNGIYYIVRSRAAKECIIGTCWSTQYHNDRSK